MALLLFTYSLQAQKTKIDTAYYDASMNEVDKSSYEYRVIYELDKKDRLVGKMLVYDSNDKLIESTTYKKGIKSGEYYKFDIVTQTSRKGFLVDGNPSGKWEVKTASGDLLASERYHKSGRIVDHTYQAFQKDGEIIEGHLLTDQATYRGGMQAWNQHLLKNLTMPRAALTAGKRSVVLTQFTVWKDGTLGNLQTLAQGEEIPPALIKEAHRVILASGQWIPARIDGAPVASNQLIRIVFQNAGTIIRN